MSVGDILSDPDYPALKEHVLRHTGLEYYLDRDEDLASRIGRRLAAQHAANCSTYLQMLSGPQGHSEMEALVGELTIGETYFFRQREHFDFLRDRIFPELFERYQTRRILRIWSAGCATGAEPYSLAILLRLHFASQIEGWDISILGTDIDVEFLAHARRARYNHWAFREMPDELRGRCFKREGKQWVLRPEFKEGVSFEYHNLAAGPPSPGGAAFDIILCRNVTIYFGREMVRRVAENFCAVLAEGGWLLVGHAEPNTEVYAHFEAVCEPGITAYRKTAAPPVFRAPTPLAIPPAPLTRPAKLRPTQPASAPAPRPAFAPICPAPPNIEDARALADRGEWAAAAQHCRDVLRADPLNAVAHFTLGLILEHTGPAAEAELALRRSIYLDRGFALAHYHLGISLQQSSPAQARKAFQNVLGLLAGKPDEEVIEHGDGIMTRELRELAKMHLDLLGER